MTARKRKEIRGVGRPMQYPARITLPLAQEMLDAIDAVLVDDIEDRTRLDFIRDAIAGELRRTRYSISKRHLARD